eukprot:g19925.t1
MTCELSSDGSDYEMAGMMKMFASVSGKMSHTDGQRQCHGFGLRHTRLLVFLTPQSKGKVQGTALVLVRVQQFRCGQVGGGLVVPADGQHQGNGFGLRHTRLLVFLTPQAKGKVQGTALVLVRVQQFSTMGVLVVWTAGRCGQLMDSISAMCSACDIRGCWCFLPRKPKTSLGHKQRRRVKPQPQLEKFLGTHGEALHAQAIEITGANGEQMVALADAHGVLILDVNGQPIQADSFKSREPFTSAQKDVLREWMKKNDACPYPTRKQKAALAKQLALTYGQVQHWFVNERTRVWRPEYTRLLVFLTPQAKGKVQPTPLVLVRVQQFRFRALACITMGLLVVWTAGRCGQVGGADRLKIHDGATTVQILNLRDRYTRVEDIRKMIYQCCIDAVAHVLDVNKVGISRPRHKN